MLKLSPTFFVYDRGWRWAMIRYAPSMFITLAKLSRDRYRQDVIWWYLLENARRHWILNPHPMIVLAGQAC